MATPLYVNPAAADDTGSGATPALAKKTIDAAYTAVDDGGEVLLLAGTYDATTQGAGWYLNLDTDKGATIKPDPTTAPTITLDPAGATRAIYFAAGAAGKTVRLENLTINVTTGSRLATLHSAFYGAAEIVDCVLACADKNISFTAATPATRSLLLSGCMITTSVESLLGITTCSFVTIDNCTITSTSTSTSTTAAMIALYAGCGRLFITNNTITLKNAFLITSANAAWDCVHIADNSFDWTPNATLKMIEFNEAPTATTPIIIQDNYAAVATSAFTPWVVWIGTGTDPSTADSYLAPQIVGNKFTHARLGYGRAISIGSGVKDAKIAFNDLVGWYAAVDAIGAFGSSIDSNYLEGGAVVIRLAGGGRATITHNHIVSRDYGGGATIGRCIIFDRNIVSTSTTTTTFTSTTVTDAGGTPWGATQSRISAGLVAMVNASSPEWWAPLQWARVVSITDNEVTVDGWKTFDADATAETPTNGHEVKIIEYPLDCLVTDNVMDGGNASYTFTFDYIPIDPRHYCDRNIYRTGSVALSILSSHLLAGGPPQDLAELKDAWDAISPTHPLNDAHSQEVFYETADYARVLRWWRMPTWAGRIKQRGLLRPI